TVEVLDGDAARERITSEGFDPRRTALVAEPIVGPLQPQAGASGSVAFEERSHERIRLRVSADRPSLLVLTDNYYPAWKARVDGDEVPVHRTNYAFRGVVVGEGEHAVEFFYDAGYLRSASLTSMALLLLLLGTGVGGLVR